ncbi:MAG: SDR family NAD(P)-dependent oxidoreductase [Agarilytica sp.]
MNGDVIKSVESSIADVFDRKPLADQPKYFLFFGEVGQDLLGLVRDYITKYTVRGSRLSESPLTFIEIDREGETRWHDVSSIEVRTFRLTVGSFDPGSVSSVLSAGYELEFSFSDSIALFAQAKDLKDNDCQFLTSWCEALQSHGVIHVREFDGESFSHIGGYDNYIEVCGNRKFFPLDDSWSVSASEGQGSYISVAYLQKRSYALRCAELSDLDVLCELETMCWPEGLAMARDVLGDRIKKNPAGQLLIEEEGSVLAVIYSQRILDAKNIEQEIFSTVDSLHNANGNVGQLLAVNVRPDMQHRRLGDQLLELMLQHCELQSEINTVVGVTRCKDYEKFLTVAIDGNEGRGYKSYQEFIAKRDEKGALIDPVLHFHELHGAKIIKEIPGYREADTINHGYGVLVSYDLNNRVRRKTDIPSKKPSQYGSILKEGGSISSLVEGVLLERLPFSDARKEFESDRPLMEMGLDSGDLLTLGETLESLFSLPFSSTFFFEFNTSEKIVKYIEEQLGLLSSASVGQADANSSSKKALNESQLGDVAIVGVSCKLPGGIETKEEFWDFLVSEESAISALPKNRWRWPDGIEPSSNHEGIDRGGFVSGIDEFDAEFFRISPRESELMDPQQRIMLQLSWQCIEDAGYAASDLVGSRTGVYIGASGSDYQLLLNERLNDVDAYTGLATSMAILPNRISYFYDFVGPSVQIDTACSSSLVAIKRAIDELRAGVCEQALVGGVHMMCHPMNSIAYYKAGMLSRDAQCKTFDDTANGYVRSEGAVTMMLKPLKNAIKDKDKIYGVLKGGAVNHGGKAGGLTVPHPGRQAELIRAAQIDASISASSISYVEAHGTGTSLGDPIEVEGLTRAFSEGNSTALSPNSCGLGSLKANLGHLEAAAGIAALLKIVICFQHQRVPSQVNFNKLNNKIDLSKTPFFVVDSPLALKARPAGDGREVGKSIRVGVSSFGSGGANAHIIVESLPSKESVSPRPIKALPIIFSAKTPEQLRERVAAVAEYIKQHPVHFVSLAYTLQVGREHMPVRWGCVVESIEELEDLLTCALKDDAFENTFVESGVSDKSPNIKSRLQSWVSGSRIDWSKLWDDIPERVSLPAYPFKKEKHWLDDGGESYSVSYSRQLSPLLQRNTSNLLEQRFSSVFSGDEFFLRDHQVNGKPVLPGVAYLEMAVSALEQSLASSDCMFNLQDVVFSQAFSVSEGDKALHVVVNPKTEELLNIEIYSDDEANSDQRNVHMRCKASLKQDIDPAQVNINDFDSLKTAQMGVGTFYESLNSMGLGYGSSHQAISELSLGLADLDNEFVLARFELPAVVSREFSQFILHPSILDAALQAIYALDIAVGDAKKVLSLPYAFDHYHCVKAIPSHGFILVQMRRGKVRVSDRSNIQVLDEYGWICGSFRGVARKEVNNSLGSNGGVSLGYLFEELWVPRAVDKSDGDLAKRYAAHYVMLCDVSDARIASLQSELNGVMLLSLNIDGESSTLSDKYASYAREMLVYLQTILSDSRRGLIKLQLILPGGANKEVFRGLGKMLRTAELENPKLSAQVMSIDSVGGKDIANAITAECVGQDFDVRIHSGGREVRIFSEVLSDKAGQGRESEVQFRDGGVYVVTGGVGRIGAAFITHILAKICRAKILVLGRSHLDGNNAKVFSTLQSLAKSNASSCEYHALDVSDKKSVKKFVAGVNATHGNINGVLHSAGVIRDGFIQLKTESELVDVFRSKVQGLEVLDRCTEKQTLDFFIAFSSTSGVFGNAAQADYAAANGFVDEYMALRKRSKKSPGASLSLSWPLWKEGGMRVDAATQARMRKSFGIQPIATKTALSVFESAIACSDQISHLTVMSGDVDEIRSYMNGAERSVNAIDAQSRAVSDEMTEGKGNNLEAALAESEKNDPSASTVVPIVENEILQEKAQQYFAKLFAKSIKLPANRIKVNEALENYGIDSIMVTQLTNILEENFGALSKTLFFEYKTIAELSHYFVDEHKEDLIEKLGLVSGLGPELKLGLKQGELLHPSGLDRNSNNDRKNTNIGASNGRFLSGSDREASNTRKQTERRSHSGPQDIAIIGLAGRYPEAESVEEFWENLLNGRDCVTEVPKDRWDMSVYFDPEKGKPGKSHSKWGGFVKGVDKFDPLFFNISPHEAEKIDPQERLFLECVYHTLEDAGYTRESLAKKFPFKVGSLNSGANIGVFVGVMYEEYQLYAAQSKDYGLLGNISSIANRASYFCDFHGPSMAVDTMCSSSLTAIHLACESIVRGECDAAVAGGVNLTVHPNKYLALSQGLFVSSNGRCMSFGEGGDGYVPGEGVGAVLLKSLDQAVDDGDQVYGVIKGTSINHGGKNNGYTVPNPNVQAAAIAKSLARADINPRTVSYIEAHGTGTALGDPIEISGLAKAFSLHTEEKEFCAIGSAKSNIGHCESAAGIAGLTKVLLQMKHRTLVPSLHCDPINEKIQFESTPFVVQKTISDWEKPLVEVDGADPMVYPRIAGLSSFGAGGSNAHMLVQEYDRADDGVTSQQSVVPVIIVLSAKTNERLKLKAQGLKEFSEKHSRTLDLVSLGYTLQVGRDAMASRLAFEVISIQELTEKLTAYIDGESDEEIFTGDVNSHSEVVYIFESDEDFSRATQAWMEKQKFSKLIELWVKGLRVEWASLYSLGLYGENRPQRISLPGYPFVKQRCWVPEGNMERPLFSGSLTVLGSNYLHPLLQSNTSSVFAQRFSSVFDGKESFLVDHKVAGNSVLPGAAFMEMARIASAESLELSGEDAWGITLKDIYFEQPAIVQSNRIALDVRLDTIDDSGLQFSILEEQGEACFAQGEAYLEEYLAEDTNISIEDYESLCSTCLEREALYSKFANIGLDYGPSHKTLKHVKVGEFNGGERIALGFLEIPAALANDVMVNGAHPSLLDGALQVCLCFFDLDNNPIPLLPFSIERVQFLRPVSTDSIVLVSTSDRADAPTQSFDVKILDAAGRLSVSVQGFSLRQSIGNAISNTDLFVGELTLSPIWERLAPELVPAWPNKSESCLVLGGNDSQISALAKILPNLSCMAIGSGLSEEEIYDQLKSRFSGDLGLDHVFFCVPGSDLNHNDIRVVEAQRFGIVTAFRLMKALLSLGYDAKPLGFTVLTRDTLSISQDSNTCPVHSALFGFLGAVNKEYLHWRVRVVDCHGVELPDIDTLLQLPPGLNAKELIYSQGQFYHQRLLPCSLSDNTTETGGVVYRDGGCYVLVGGAGGLGEVFSEYLIKEQGAQVVWLGRREMDNEIEAKCQRLSEFGLAPHYISVDATNITEMKSAAADIRTRFGVIHGVVHSALVLNDKGLASMDEEVFSSSLDAKIDVSVNLVNAFDDSELDFMLFFSSLQSLYRPAGQSNYAAGCAFVDAYAVSLDYIKPYAVKTINWGFWGSIGIVASEDYRLRMKEVGLGSVEPSEGLPVIERVLSSTVSQVAYLKTTKTDIAKDLSVDRHKSVRDFGDQNSAPLVVPDARDFPVDARILEEQVKTLDALLAKVLYCQLDQLGVFSSLDSIASLKDTALKRALEYWVAESGFVDSYSDWLVEAISSLIQHGLLASGLDCVDDDENLLVSDGAPNSEMAWADWESFCADILSARSASVTATLQSQVGLVDATLKSLPDILLGRTPATNVIFPDASVALVEGVYKNNHLSDYFNDVLADNLIVGIDELLYQEPQRKIKILEIGAGTGGTSALLFKRLEAYKSTIAEYAYTDISKAFLMHAEEHYRESAPYLKTKLFDVTKPLINQDVLVGDYDFVIATNVLHATPDIGITLRNSKALLADNGVLLINELSHNSVFLNLTFGLLSGWWLSQDASVRIEGSPLLTPDGWARSLHLEGYEDVAFPAERSHPLGQQIVIAKSNGVAVIETDSEIGDVGNAGTITKIRTSKDVKKPGVSGQNKDVTGSVSSSDEQYVIADEKISERTSAPAAAVVDSTADTKSRFESFLKKLVADTLKMSPAQLDVNESFESYGVDSILVVRLTSALRESIGEISATLLFEVTNLGELVDYFIDDRFERVIELVGQGSVENNSSKNTRENLGRSDSAPVAEPPDSSASVGQRRNSIRSTRFGNRKKSGARSHHDERSVSPQKSGTEAPLEDVAIVGISGRFPQAETLTQFWDNLCAGKNCIEEIPSSRWDWRDEYTDKKGEIDKIYTKWGGFLKDVDAFDPLFFNISPREATAMDPQERLFLQCAYESIEDSGYTATDLSPNKRVGVFVGVMNNTYQQQPTHWSIANRVSYFLDFNGPSLAVDTACSSSLTAIILASEKIRDGSCDACIAGGVNLIVDSEHYRGLSNMTMLSERDECASFGASADGFVDGEGVGAVLLKPLSQALKEGAHIYGIIKGGAINHGGKTNGYTVPNPKSQAAAISDALSSAGVLPRQISYIEAHGTGTTLGDPIEVSGLSLAFSKQTEEKQFCALGSVKSNIGHSESAAGIAALTKVLLQMKHKKIVPSLHSHNLNPNIEFSKTPFRVQQSLEDWEKPSFSVNDKRVSQGPRIAGISSFGAGGANAHLIVQEYSVPEDKKADNSDRPSIIIISAKSEAQVAESMAALLAGLDDFEGELEDLAYTLQVGRAAFEVRAGVIANSKTELKRKLSEHLNSTESASEVVSADIRDHKESLSVLASDDDFNTTLKSWLEREKYEKILDVWTKGVSVDWSSLHADTHPKRISLPLYPFEKNRYWKTADALPRGALKSDSVESIPADKGFNGLHAFSTALHPLVHINTSTLSQQKFTTRFSGKEFFLADHIIQGRKTLPSAVIVEIARVASSYALFGNSGEQTLVDLSDIVFIQPLCSTDLGAEIEIHITPVSENDIVFELCTFNGAEERVHAKGTGSVRTEEVQHRRIDLDQLRESCEEKVSVRDLYELFDSFGINFGERHRPITSLRHSNNREQKNVAIAELTLSESLQGDSDQFVLHPSLLDGAFQSSIAILIAGNESGNIQRPQPFQLGKLEVFSTLPKNSVVVVVSDGQAERSTDLNVDIFVCDNEGSVCAEVLGFRSRLSAMSPGEKSDDLPARSSRAGIESEPRLVQIDNVGDLLLSSQWEAVEPDFLTTATQSSAVLVLGGDAVQRSALSEYFPNVIQLESLKRFDKETLGVDVIEDALKNASRFDHIVVIAPKPSHDEWRSEHICEAQQLGVFNLYRLVKALLALKYERSELRLTVITQQARSLSREDIGYAEHSSMHGFAGAIIKEIPQWKLQLIDLPLVGDWPTSQIFSLPDNPHGRPMLYRLGAWYQQVLRHIELSDEVRPAFRKNGVYVILGGAGGAGSAFSQYLVSEYCAQVIWLGRRKENDKIREKCDALEKLGVRPFYISVDATDKAELEKASQSIADKYGAVNGIVHSALVMSGASLQDMDEKRFSGGLGAKLEASVCVNDVFGHDDLDFNLFFSSIQAFDIEPKQSNYSAGTSFTDGFVESLNSRVSYPVKVVNWGYIAGTEFVSMLSFQQWMEKEGFGAVDILDSMPVIEKILVSPVTQCVIHKTTKSSAAKNLPIAVDAMMKVHKNKAEFGLAYLPVKSSLLLPLSPERYEEQVGQFDEVLAELLTLVLSEMGILSTTTAIPGSSKSVVDIDRWKKNVNLPSYLSQWLDKSLQTISQYGFLSQEEGAWVLDASDLDRQEIIEKWVSCKNLLEKSAAFKAQASLIDAVFPQIEDVLRGNKTAPQVLFPSSSLDLVEGIYKNNKVSDYFNEVVAESLIVAMESRLQESPEKQFKILEVGAGTGGTSQLLFDRLSSFKENITEYCYTDVSSTFLKHANDTFLEDAPYLRTQILDIESDIDSSLIGEYDFVIASNVLHATSDIIKTLRHVKLILKDGGILLLNELVENSLFLHLSFGLLEGWWLSKDLPRRIPGSPLLDASQWQQAFAQCGFTAALQPAQDASSLRHQIFVTQSDGLCLSSVIEGRDCPAAELLTNERENDALAKRDDIPTPLMIDIVDAVDVPSPEVNVRGAELFSGTKEHQHLSEKDGASESDIEGVVIQHLREGLMLDDHVIDKNRSFADYGVDSVTGIRLVEEINVSLGTNLSPTSIFDYSSVSKLVSHIKTMMPQDEPALSVSSLEPPVDVVALPTAEKEPIQSSRIQTQDTRDVVLAIIAESLDIEPEKIRSEDSFADYGVDSVTGIRIVELLNEALNITLSPTSLFDYSSVNKLVEHINNDHASSEDFDSQAPSIATSAIAPKPIESNKRNIASNNKKRGLPKVQGRKISRAPKSYMTEHEVTVARTETPTAAGRVGSDFEKSTKFVPSEISGQQASTRTEPAKDPIAIIGMSGRFATANNVNTFWEHLVKGDDLTESVSRWDLSQVEGSDAPTFCDRGGFLSDIDCFDSLFFNISGIEAAYIDPQQRLFLEESWKALEDAGYAGESIQGRRCGVFAGCNGSDYGDLFIGDKSPAQALWGNAASLLSARIAYYLDFKGPAITIDTACSSSLSAIHMACQSIRAGETELALAGGVFVQSTAKFYEMANRASMLSADGKCHTFDEQANGFVPGEGVGVLMLKKLSDAQRDGDHIYGVVLGSGTNQDGTTNGITAPSAVSQERLISDIYEKYDISPQTIQSVEAHGTGTKLGDPIEFEALTRAFNAVTSKRGEQLSVRGCALGAVKTNIGHTTAASGVAGVIKLLMSFKNNEIAPSINFKKSNRHIHLEDSPFYIPASRQEWPASESRGRRAAISSFGLSGTNVHAVLEESPVPLFDDKLDPQPIQGEQHGFIIVLSAISKKRLDKQVRKLIHFCREQSPDCMSVSYTLATGRKHFPYRFSCIARDIQELIALLNGWLQGESSKVLFSSEESLSDALHISEKEFSNAMERCEAGAASANYGEDLAMVARGFCQGFTPKFLPLYQALRCQKISLPGSVFEKKRHWVSPGETTIASSGKAISQREMTQREMAQGVTPVLEKEDEEYEQLFERLMNDDISIDDALDVIS